MNIFFLDKDPKKSAEYHCDKHVVKMCIEYAQLLSTALHITNSIANEYVYKPTHVFHPCTIWVSQSLSHWKWLWLLGHHLGNEFTKRYNAIHLSTRVLRNLPVPTRIKDVGWLSDPPKAMPDAYKVEDTVQSYRNYYLGDKAKFCKWKIEKPGWWTLEV